MFACVWVASGLVLLGVSGGCTSQQLRLSTTRQARTLAETQYEQVPNNLAMTCVDPSVLPSLVSLKTGSTQIGDTGTLGFLGTAGLDTKFGASPTVSGSRSIVDQWGNVPVTDDNELKILRRAFRTARGIPDLLSEEEATDLGHDLAQQIGTNSDISSADINLQKIFDVKVRIAFDNYKLATAPPVADTEVKSATPPAPALPALPGTEESTTYGPPRRTFDLDTHWGFAKSV